MRLQPPMPLPTGRVRRAPHPLLVLAAVGGLLAAASAWAAFNPYPNAAFGVTEVGTSPTQIGGTLNQREGVEACNLGPAPIYCAFTSGTCAASGLTTSNGRPVTTGSCWSGGVSFNVTYGRARLCCVAASAQVSPADTRWNEVY